MILFQETFKGAYFGFLVRSVYELSIAPSRADTSPIFLVNKILPVNFATLVKLLRKIAYLPYAIKIHLHDYAITFCNEAYFHIF